MTDATISTKAEKLRTDVLASYDLTPVEMAVLDAGLEALDTADAAQEIVNHEGVVITDRFGFAVRHPAVGIVKEAKAQFLQAMKQLGLADPYGGSGGHGRGVQKARR